MEQVTVEDIAALKPPCVSISTTTTIEEAAKLLKQKNILSAPVWCEEERRFVGFIDVLDIVSHAVVVAHTTIEKKNLSDSPHLREKYSIFTAEELKKLDFSYGYVGEILQLPGSEKRKIHLFFANAKLENVMKILSHHQRALVQHTSKSWFSFVNFFTDVEYKVCTQTDIVRYVVDHLSDARFSWGVSFGKRVEDSEFNDRFLSITTKEKAIDGFLKMLEEGGSACAVLDENNGRLVTTLSASDLRGISAETLKYIVLPPMEFIFRMTNQRAPSPVTCGAEETLAEVAQRILQNRKHECWLVDSAFKPVRLITLQKLVRIASRSMKPS